MGASVSRNVIKIVNDVVSNISTNIVQKTKLTNDTRQVISVEDVHGDVHIVGNVFYQRANINMNALMTALTSQESQQQIIEDIAQRAKSMISGLNLGQYSDARNTLNVLTKILINITTTVTQECASQSRASQSIIVKRVKGNLYIQNNVFTQIADIIYSCVQNAVTNNKALSDISNKLDQDASAKAEGLSEWTIVAIAALIIGLPVVGGIVAGKAILRYLFPLLIVVGVAVLAVYFLWTTEDIKLEGYSTLIANAETCLPSVLLTSTQYPNIARAAEYCLKTKECAAFDWNSVDLKTKKVVLPPKTTFYSSVSSSCHPTQDQTSTLRVANVMSGSDDPSSVKAQPYDVYINRSNSAYFQFKDDKWLYLKRLITDASVGNLIVSSTKPKPTDVADNFIYYDKYNPKTFHLYRLVSGGVWKEVATMAGPGVIPDAPALINGSGFKVTNRKESLLYLGATAIGIGLIGTIVNVFRRGGGEDDDGGGGALRGGGAKSR